MPLRGRQVSPYRLYLILECGMSFMLGISYATVTVYWVTSARLNPLQLLLLGTSLELSYFVFQLPTGVLADLVSRRLCVLTGLFIVGAGPDYGEPVAVIRQPGGVLGIARPRRRAEQRRPGRLDRR